MRFHIPLLLAVSTIASASPVLTKLVKRDGAAVVNAVDTVAEKITTLNSTVTSYTGGVQGTLTALQIEYQSVDLENALKDAIRTTESSANFTDAESLNVAGAFIDLEPKIFSTLDNIVRKKPQFSNGLLGIGSLSFLVRSNLETQRDLAAELGDAVTAKLTKIYAAIAPTLNEAIANKFEEAIAAYS